MRKYFKTEKEAEDWLYQHSFTQLGQVNQIIWV
jgi:hypothetical protein